MTHSFDLLQMHSLIKKHRGSADLDRISIVYVATYGDYWEHRDEFISQFMSVPQDHDIVIHVRFEGLSLVHCGIVAIVERLLTLRGQDPSTVFVFSPNSIQQDSPWPNIYWHQFPVSDEFIRSKLYTTPPLPVIESPLTWAMFVGRRTMPRIKMLFDCHREPWLKQRCLLSLMNNQVPETEYFWKQSNRYYDNMTDWIEPELQKQFRDWYVDCPVNSVDNHSVQDQYLDTNSGENRNQLPTLSLLGLQSQYLFEIVFETMTLGSTFTPSEKTVRTIMAQKATVTYAPPGFLYQMRKMGFETFGDLWDESYDQLQGLPRYRAMLDIIKSVAAMPLDQQNQLYQHSQELCGKNYKKLLELQK